MAKPANDSRRRAVNGFGYQTRRLTPTCLSHTISSNIIGILLEDSSNLREINRKLELYLPLKGANTLNELTLDHLEDIPEAGTSLKITGYPIEIIQIHDRTVKMVRIFPAQTSKQ